MHGHMNLKFVVHFISCTCAFPNYTVFSFYPHSI